MNLLFQRRLLFWAALFLLFYSLTLTLSPAVRERSWAVDYRLAHWGGLLVWGVGFAWLHFLTSRYLGEHDPYLLPLLALFSGWGLLTIFRLDVTLGWRQTLWLSVGVVAGTLALLHPEFILALQRYKYLWLSIGLLLTALTLIFGRNPAGAGPRLWLGCCGVYFQPSEALKLLFVVYLAAYLAEYGILLQRVMAFLRPTLMVAGLAVLLLIVQRDLGTASLLILLYAAMLYLGTGRREIALFSIIGLTLAAAIGYFSVPIVRERIQVWIFPWDDPSGRAYQIVQSLIAIANGGVFGRGPGLGNPGLVPIAHSDFIFAAIAEESGLFGAIALLALWALLFQRGLSVAFHAPTRFQRLLAAGISLYLGIQGLVIIGGNIRIFPLTGVTLPLISYGGSSLLAGMFSVFLLLLISHHPDSEPIPLRYPQTYYQVSLAFLALSGAMALAVGWWGVMRAERLLMRTDNPRRAIADLYVRRGSLLDRLNRPLNETIGNSGSYQRVYHYPPLSPLLGYTHAVYGQAGLEASLDDWLRGLKGNPAFALWWNHILYGTPPPGLDVRLSLDLALQRFADDLLGERVGAIVALNARSGEVLVSASHPWFDPNHLDENWGTWMSAPASPFLNRVTQGYYPLGDVLLPWEKALLGESGVYAPSAVEQVYSTLLGMAMMKSPMHVAPLDVVRIGATLSAGGVKPATRFVLAVNTPGQGWVVIPAEGESKSVLSPFQARALAQRLTPQGAAFWEYLAEVKAEKPVTWYLAGTLPEWQGVPIALVVLLEEENPTLAKQIGQAIMRRWMLGE